MSADEMNTLKNKKANTSESEELFSATFEQAAMGIAHVAPDMVSKKASLETSAHLLYKPVSPFELLRKVRCVLDNKK